MIGAPRAIDLNADLGEGFGRWTLGDDGALLDVVSSANVACGFHAGDPQTMVQTCAAASERDVRIGAHVGYRDLVGFGRRALEMPHSALAADVTYQLGALAACARAVGAAVRYVKPHGALYHRCAEDQAVARTVAGAVRDFDDALAVLCLPGSALLEAAIALDLQGVAEGFADRRYTVRGSLVDRTRPRAILSAQDARAQALALASGTQLEAADGGTVAVEVASICVHGDTPGAAQLAREIRDALEGAGHALAPFA